MNLFVASGMRLKGHEVPVERLARACVPMILVALAVLVLITLIPQITLFLIT